MGEEKSIGPYTILENLGKGGMGEVYLVKDPSSGRSVALKRIRPDLQKNKTIQNRFLREATVASFLSHPSIVPILSIQPSPPEIYYTMSFVEGETLRQILRELKEKERAGHLNHPVGRSIPALTRIFLQICEAVAYTHSKGILHRDLKPENIIVGRFGEVMILDWGIADFIQNIEKQAALPKKQEKGNSDLTRPGKIAGTLAYMAPERLFNKSSSEQTDIYALGVILYQILTLELPFQRKTLAAFKKSADKEEFLDPTEMAPYRDIPKKLVEVCQKSLAKDPKTRYKTMEALISDLKSYIEGRADWIFLGDLDLNESGDWQFQENILPSKNVAITQNLDVTEWAALMISKRSLTENLKISAELTLHAGCRGVGFLFSVPDVGERKSLEEGYCLWLAPKERSSQLFRNNVQILDLAGISLEPEKKHRIEIEKLEDHIQLFLDGELKLSFTSYLPLAGSHVGFLYKDGDFSISKISLFDGSHSVMVSCLAVPRAFLSRRLYDPAFQEYQRLSQCFSGRMEGREAIFRGGLSLLEKGRFEKKPEFFHLALKEFEKLSRTPSAPLEYLGKSIVYSAMEEYEEEAKCLELSLRKFPHHPLFSLLKKHIFFRMHESSLSSREAAYRMILLAIRNIPDILQDLEVRSLLDTLKENWQELPFIDTTESPLQEMAIQIAFWLKKPPFLIEMIERMQKQEKVDLALFENALFALFLLEGKEAVQSFPLPFLKKIDRPFSEWELPKTLKKRECRALLFSLEKHLLKSPDLTLKSLAPLKNFRMSKADRIHFDAIEAWGYLLQHKPSLAGAILRKYTQKELTGEGSPLHFVYGTWIYVTKGPKAALLYFHSALETPFPKTTALASHFLSGRIDDKRGWIERAFWWEKRELHKQLELFYKTIGKKR